MMPTSAQFERDYISIIVQNGEIDVPKGFSSNFERKEYRDIVARRSELPSLPGPVPLSSFDAHLLPTVAALSAEDVPAVYLPKLETEIVENAKNREIRRIAKCLADDPSSASARSALIDLIDRQEPKNAPGNISWPQLSSSALTGLLGEFVEMACKKSEADPAAVAATFLVRFGIEAGTSAYVSVGEGRHRPRLNGVIVGESSKARKGTSAGPVKTVFAGLHSPCQTSSGPLSSGEGLIYAVRDEQTSYVVDRKTGEGQQQVTDPGVEDKRLFVLDEEFANALNATMRDGNNLSGVIRGLYDDGDAAPLTKSNKIGTTGAHVGIISHITISELKAKLSKTEQLNGFGNRFLWICARRQCMVPFPEPIPDYERTILRKLIQERLEHAFRGGEYRFSAEARGLWSEAYPRLSMAHKGLAGCMINRGEAHIVRLALINALLALHKQIELEDLEAAISFWSYCEQSALYLFGGEQGDSRKQKILTALTAQPRMARNEIRERVFQKHVSSEALTALLKEMEEENLIESLVERTGGAPKHIVILKRA